MKAYPVTVLCRVMKVSRSGFYEYPRHYNNRIQDQKQMVLEALIRSIFNASKKTYGSRRIVRALKSRGYDIGRYRVRSLMRKLELKAKTPKRYRVTTDSNHSYLVSTNIVNRQFTVDAPNKVWTADITYLWTLEGWSYLAVIMDLFSRQVVGWAVDKHMKVELVLDALMMPIGAVDPHQGSSITPTGVFNMLVIVTSNNCNSLKWSPACAEKVTAGIMLQPSGFSVV
jgi:putative transposase